MKTIARKILQSILVLPICLLAPLPVLMFRRPDYLTADEVIRILAITLIAPIGIVALVASIFWDPKKETPKRSRFVLGGLLIGIGLDCYILSQIGMATWNIIPSDPWQVVFNTWVFMAPFAVAIWNGVPRIRKLRETKNLPAAVTSEVILNVPNSPYTERLNATKEAYPFPGWAKCGLPQCTPEACARFVEIFDRLLLELAQLGKDAPEDVKLLVFKRAVLALNKLNEEDSSLIETGEREDLCALCNVVAKAAGIDPEKYGDGEGPASEWRDW